MPLGCQIDCANLLDDLVEFDPSSAAVARRLNLPLRQELRGQESRKNERSGAPRSHRPRHRRFVLPLNILLHMAVGRASIFESMPLRPLLSNEAAGRVMTEVVALRRDGDGERVPSGSIHLPPTFFRPAFSSSSAAAADPVSTSRDERGGDRFRVFGMASPTTAAACRRSPEPYSIIGWIVRLPCRW